MGKALLLSQKRTAAQYYFFGFHGIGRATWFAIIAKHNSPWNGSWSV
jgi:hypothetical protein